MSPEIAQPDGTKPLELDVPAGTSKATLEIVRRYWLELCSPGIMFQMALGPFNECVGLEATTENQSWIAVEAPTQVMRNPGSSFASHRKTPSGSDPFTRP